MKTGYRLCLGCLEDWTWDVGPLCPACLIEHDLHRAASARIDVTPDNPSGVDWWGPTQQDVDPEDLKGGYSVLEWSKD